MYSLPDIELQIAHLYPQQLNIYGDRGNVLALAQRCLWRGWRVRVTPLDLEAPVDPDAYDLYFMGGGQDAQQWAVAADLKSIKAEALKQAAANGAVFLGICGGYQLMGHYYQPHDGPKLPGLSLIDAYTEAGHTRMIGNVLVERPDGTSIVGFENHSGRTFLGPGVAPLGRVLSGYGNCGEPEQHKRVEGAVVGNLYGTYLHGSLLPKNPHLADELIAKALKRRYGEIELPALDDTLEYAAADAAKIQALQKN